MAAERVLTERELNRAVLARQLLLARAEVALPDALQRVGGIQAQYAPSMYIGLWSRVAGFERAALTRSLENRAVVQATLMRSTIHLVAPEDYWPIALAVRRPRRDDYLRAWKDLTPERMRRAARKLRRALTGGGTLNRAEIVQLVGKTWWSR